MKFRLDFVTNSSSSSYLAISVHSSEFVELMSQLQGPWRNGAPNIDEEDNTFVFSVDDVNREDLYDAVPCYQGLLPDTIAHWIDELCTPISADLYPQIVSSLEKADCAEMIVSYQHEDESSAKWFKGSLNGTKYDYKQSSRELDSTFDSMVLANSCESNYLCMAICSREIIDFANHIDVKKCQAEIECFDKIDTALFSIKSADWSIIDQYIAPPFKYPVQLNKLQEQLADLANALFWNISKDNERQFRVLLKYANSVEVITHFYGKSLENPTEFRRILIQDGSYDIESNGEAPYSSRLEQAIVAKVGQKQEPSSSLVQARKLSEAPLSLSLIGMVIASFGCTNEREVQEVVQYHDGVYDNSSESIIDILIIGNQYLESEDLNKFISMHKFSKKVIGLTEEEFWKFCRKMSERLPVSMDADYKKLLSLWEYEINHIYDNSVTLTSYKGKEKKVSVPAEIDGYRVTALKSTFKDNTFIQSVRIPEGVTSLLDNTFGMCTTLISVELPSTLRMIGEYAFSVCSSLSNILEINQIREIKRFAFLACSQLEEIKYSDKLKDIVPSAFAQCSRLFMNKQFVVINGLLTLCRSNEDIVQIPDGVEVIGWEAFSSCNVKKIILPKSVRVISSNALKNCTQLSAVIMQDGIKQIDYQAFTGLSRLQELSIPASVQKFYGAVFHQCRELRTVVFEEGIEAIESLNYNFFSGCPNVTRIVIPSSVKSITCSQLPNTKKVRYVVPAGSYANKILTENGFSVINAAE